MIKLMPAVCAWEKVDTRTRKISRKVRKGIRSGTQSPERRESRLHYIRHFPLIQTLNARLPSAQSLFPLTRSFLCGKSSWRLFERIVAVAGRTGFAGIRSE
jgi:hypothetical protein